MLQSMALQRVRYDLGGKPGVLQSTASQRVRYDLGGKPGVLQSTASQRVRYDLGNDQQHDFIETHRQYDTEIPKVHYGL